MHAINHEREIKKMPKMPGKLYVVATPIGNLDDFSRRGIDTLKNVDLIAAEDTRHIQGLLNRYAIKQRCVALHQHNEEKQTEKLLQQVQSGLNVALVSDAGTPLLSDPGMPLVKAAREAGVEVLTVPGPCALIAALSVAGLPVNRFLFEGFLPRTKALRKTFIEERKQWDVVWVVYESSHRVYSAITDFADILPPDRPIVLARELTKLYETVIKATALEIKQRMEQDAHMQKGEFVIIVGAACVEKKEVQLTDEQKRVLSILLQECSIKTAVSLAVEITGARKKILYQAALDLAGKHK